STTARVTPVRCRRTPLAPPTVTTTASAPSTARRATSGSAALPVTTTAPAGALPLRETTVTSRPASSASSAPLAPVPWEPPMTVSFTGTSLRRRRRRRVRRVGELVPTSHRPYRRPLGARRPPPGTVRPVVEGAHQLREHREHQHGDGPGG